jgi:hypothetical protein
MHEEGSMTRTLATVAIVCLAAACATAPVAVEAPTTGQPAAAPPPNANSIPAGTVLNVRLTQELNTAQTRMGDTFTATVEEPLVAANGQTVIPQGSVITGMVTGVGATEEGQAAIRVNFLRIALDGISHPLSARVLDTAPPGGTLAPEAREIVTGAAVGAALGAVIGGDLRTALIGGILGAGAGTIVSLGTGDVEPVLPEGTLLRIQTRDLVDLRP